MSLCTVILAYDLPPPINHLHYVPTDVGAMSILSSSQFTLHLILTKSPPLGLHCCCNDCSGSFFHITYPAAAVDCGTPPAANVNGNPPVYTTTTFGSTVKYTCQSGYMREGDRYITCLANGNWNASAPDCNRECTPQQHTFVSWWYCTSTVK